MKNLKKFLVAAPDFSQHGEPELQDYTEAELANILAVLYGFDVEAARAAGHSDAEILEFLTSRSTLHEAYWR